ncbi:hypothetical protein R3P38DRAFT_3482432 [Favolaschia claudopus]|uniref:Uncharacterized protein n=1 Tax=Favolaschia claudopus TaxID=2862362 RepID=A0AAV9Z8B1_9AGAR
MARLGKRERDKKKEQEAIPQAILSYLQKNLAGTDITDIEQAAAIGKHIAELRGLSQADDLSESQIYPELQKQLRFCMSLAQNHKLPTLFRRLQQTSQQISNNRGLASHQEKQSLVYKLNLACSRHRSLAQVLANFPVDPQAPAGTLFNPRIVWRKRNLEFGPRTTRNIVPTDTLSRSDPRDFVCSEENGFYRVPVTESVIFANRDKDSQATAELIVLRDVFGDDSPERETLLAWYQQTIDAACAERRNVRPNHPGHMAQIGWNAGPRHARVFQAAKSYTKNLDLETRIEHDLDSVAALSLTWALVKALAPSDIPDTIEKTLADSGLPKIATRDVPEGIGSRLVLKGKTYLFPFDRAPPEG